MQYKEKENETSIYYRLCARQEGGLQRRLGMKLVLDRPLSLNRPHKVGHRRQYRGGVYRSQRDHRDWSVVVSELEL